MSKSLQTVVANQIRTHDVYLVTASQFGYFDSWPVRGQPFCLVIVADRQAMPVQLQEFFDFVRSAIELGCRLFLTAGNMAAQMEDLIDEQAVEEKIDESSSLKSDDIVMTVALKDQTLDGIVEAVFDIYQCPERYKAKECPIIFFLLQGDYRLESFRRWIKVS